MKQLILISFTLITGLMFASASFACKLPSAHPHDADREMLEMEETVFAVTIASGEAIDIDATGVKRVTVDESRLLHAKPTDDKSRLVLTGREVGKVVVRLHLKSGEVTTFIVTVS